jgi:predicted metal-dependent enzyme (double-stranded beta helix superfamily)
LPPLARLAWARSQRALNPPSSPDRITPTHEIILNPGDVIALTADAIHSVEPLGDEPTISFNLYGVTNFQQHYQFDPDQQTAQQF